jgi:putative copper resistance protein D
MEGALALPLTIVRALHFAAAVVLFGQFAYLAWVAPRGAPPARFRAIAGWSLAAAVATALAWLAIEASNMSGLPMGEALHGGTVGIVLSKTLFGHAWLARGALALVVAIALAAMGARGARSRGARAVGTIAAALFLAALALAGHAAAESGAQRLFHVVADALHLLAAGGWVGALVPFVMLLRAVEARPSAQALEDAAIASRKFSSLGIACVAVLALTGTVNACYALHRVADLFTSRYGEELLLKLALVAAMVALAALNRLALTPAIVSGEARRAEPAVRALARNALAEVVLGFAVLAVVATLGITMPPMPAG